MEEKEIQFHWLRKLEYLEETTDLFIMLKIHEYVLLVLDQSSCMNL